MKNKIKKKKSGFTLVELLSVIIVLGLVVGIVVFVATSVINNAKSKSYEVIVNNIENIANSYIMETELPISWINKDGGGKEYVCIIVQDLIDAGYFKSDILSSYVDKDVKVNNKDFIYLERDSNTKTVDKEILLSQSSDELSEYLLLCEDIDKYGIINIKYEPIGWSKSKDIFIEYKLINNIDYLSGYTYGYKYNDNELVDIDNVFDSYIEKQNLTINNNGTIYGEIKDKNDVRVKKSIDITNIDNEGPIITMGNYTGSTDVSWSVMIPIKVSDVGVGVDSNSFTTNDIVVSIGDKVVNDGINLIKVDDNNYNLQINNNIDSGLIKIEIDENKVFDKLENPNGKFEMNTVIRFNNLYTVSYDANGGTGAPSSQTKKYGESLTLSSTIPINLGYTFLGWSTSSSAISALYQPGSEFTINDNVILYAVWKKSEINPISSYWCKNGHVGSSPYELVYTGNCTVHNDGDGDWRIDFLTSGDLTVSATAYIDAFLVGGGGGGGKSVYKTAHYGEESHEGGGGGGGGYITGSNSSIEILAKKSYKIIVGAGGASGADGRLSSAFGLTANGGKAGNNGIGGAGGSGGGAGAGWHDANAGNGGYNGGAGIGNEYYNGGTGQGTIMSEFGTYGGGGGGGNSYWVEAEDDGDESWYTTSGKGGTGGGGNGGNKAAGSNGKENTGGGGGGGGASSSKKYSGGKGGSGIVIIRNFRVGCEIGDKIIPNFEYTGFCESIDDGNGNWRIKFLTSGILTLTSSFDIDVFLVGGGGGGGNSVHKTAHGGEESQEGGGGGGGGYINTSTSLIKVLAKKSYKIIVGAGGVSGTAGSASSAFGLTANGGKGGSNGKGGAGSSGGGAGAGWKDTNAGNGGSNGGSGGRNSYYTGGIGQGATTSEFGENGATLYGGGGGGGNSYWDNNPDDLFYGLHTSSGKGGKGGGGNGGNNSAGSFGTNNTGGGGGGGGSRSYGGSGGSGIVIIRNKR